MSHVPISTTVPFPWACCASAHNSHPSVPNSVISHTTHHLPIHYPTDPPPPSALCRSASLWVQNPDRQNLFSAAVSILTLLPLPLQSVIRRHTIQQTTKNKNPNHPTPPGTACRFCLRSSPSISALLASSRRVSQSAATNVSRLGHGLDSSRQTTFDPSPSTLESTDIHAFIEALLHLDTQDRPCLYSSRPTNFYAEAPFHRVPCAGADRSVALPLHYMSCTAAIFTRNRGLLPRSASATLGARWPMVIHIYSSILAT